MPLPSPGETILGKYAVTEPLGAGGMGTVYAARDLRLGGHVALKFLHPDLAARPDLASRFEQEARAGRAITSHRVAKVHGIESYGDFPFIVMEYVDGETVEKCLARRGALPIAEAVDLVLQACEPVNEAHTLGIVHRDLKPANMVLTTDKRGDTLLKVLDFGISKFDNVSNTSSESALGTPLYMSPEQVSDAGQVDARSDVWSLNVVFCELLTGKRPFEGATRSAVYIAIKSGRRPTLRSLNPAIPPLLEEAVERAFALAVEDRVASVEAFAASIAPFGTKSGAALLEQIQGVAQRASSKPPVPTATLAPVHTAPGVDRTSLGGSVLGTPPPVLAKPAPAKSRAKLFAAVGALAVVSAVGTVGVRSHWFGGRPSIVCPDGATPSCEAACRANEPGACHALARSLRDGQGAPADPVRAFGLFQAECTSGGMAGCESLGNMYDTGIGVQADRKQALSLFQKACEGGFGAGCVSVGNAFVEGEVTVKDRVQALDFYKLGCARGEPLGCSNASMFLHDGVGSPKDAPRDFVAAYTYADKACTQGAEPGCVLVAKAKIAGEGVAQDATTGLAQLEAMCARDEKDACKALADVYEGGLGIPVNADKGGGYRQKACDLHDDVSCRRLKTKNKVTLTATMAGQINATLRDQCDSGKMKSCEMFGRNLQTGTGVTMDEVSGAEYLAKACMGGEKTACEPTAAR